MKTGVLNRDIQVCDKVILKDSEVVIVALVTDVPYVDGEAYIIYSPDVNESVMVTTSYVDCPFSTAKLLMFEG